MSCEADEVFEPQRLKPQLSPEGKKFIRELIVQEIVARDDGDGRCAAAFVLAESPKESKTVDEWHPQVQDDGVGRSLSRFSQPVFGRHRRSDGVAFKPEHLRKRLRHPFIVIDDENVGWSGFEQRRGH
jgi:hypothetical protein